MVITIGLGVAYAGATEVGTRTTVHRTLQIEVVDPSGTQGVCLSGTRD